jgi:hypothetical protein
MEIRRTYPHHLLSEDPKARSKEEDKNEQLRKDWGYTNQYRRMMQRRREEQKQIPSED